MGVGAPGRLARSGAERLDRRHGLLAQVLRVLGDPAARAEVEVPVDLIDPLRDTDPYNSMAAAYDDVPAPGSEVIAVADEDQETDLDDILQRRWA